MALASAPIGRQILSDRYSASGCCTALVQHEAEHLAVGRGVAEARAGGRLALLEFAHGVGAALGLLPQGVVDELRCLVAPS